MHIQSDLSVRYGQATDAGVKAQNDDCLGIRVPDGDALVAKGIAMVLADGVSSAEAGREAAEICVQGFLSDYYSTPDTWQVKTAGHRVLVAINRWLYGKGQAFSDARKGYVCALSAAVLKSRSAHLFHVGDVRFYLLRDGQLEQLTQDHRTWVSEEKSYLARAVGVGMNLDIDYRRVRLEPGDCLFSCTDGVYESLSDRALAELLEGDLPDLDASCELIVNKAIHAGSRDNVSCQLLAVEGLSETSASEVYEELGRLPFPPPLSPGMVLDGYEVLELLEESPRSQLYLVRDPATGERVVMKTPSERFSDDPAYIERFLIEEWVGRRVSSPHIVEVLEKRASPKFLYYLMEEVEGQSLSDWMEANPQPEMGQVVAIVEQIMAGARALHRKETLHQDLKPDNIILRPDGVVKIIDLGSVLVAGIRESEVPFDRLDQLGTRRYSAPEYSLGRRPNTWSDLFAVGIIAYQLFGGGKGHPYGERYERAQTIRDFSVMRYRSVATDNPLVPVWIDGALERSVCLHPENRYQAFSEFLMDLKRPNPDFLKSDALPILERNPVLFWKVLSGVLFVCCLILLFF